MKKRSCKVILEGSNKSFGTFWEKWLSYREMMGALAGKGVWSTDGTPTKEESVGEITRAGRERAKDILDVEDKERINEIKGVRGSLGVVWCSAWGRDRWYM